jgi:DNA-binding NarL/FixJ family response regulator
MSQSGDVLQANKPLRVLIAENHRDLSDVMSQLIDTEPDMECVGQVSDASTVLAAVRDTSADVLILDLMLQGGSGLPLVEELIHEMPELRVIIFSGLANSEEVAREVKRRGAAAFVTKGCDFQVLLDALRPPSPQAPRLAG